MGYVHSPTGDVYWGIVSADPQIRFSDNGVWATFVVRFSNAPDGYIKCKTGGVLVPYVKYLRRGMRIMVSGRFETGEAADKRRGADGKIIKWRSLRAEYIQIMPPIEVWAYLTQNTPIDQPPQAKAPEEWEINRSAASDVLF